MSVFPEKLETIINMCSELQSKKFCCKRQLQSLLGSLLFISKCVKPARTVLNCMFTIFRPMGTENQCSQFSDRWGQKISAHNFQIDGDRKSVSLIPDFFRGLNWFCTFMKQFNGIVYYDVRPMQAELHLDACLTGLDVSLTISVTSHSKEF